jgi:hypothetical protein
MNDLIDTWTTTYGVTFTIVIIATIMIIAIIIALLPLFAWNIHSQAAKTTKELIKLNKLIERLIAKQPSNEKLNEVSSKSRRADEMIRKIFKEKQIEPLSKEKIPEQTIWRKKVFIKPEDELPDHKKKTS